MRLNSQIKTIIDLVDTPQVGGKVFFPNIPSEIKDSPDITPLAEIPGALWQLSKIYQTVGEHAIDPEEAVYWSSGRSYRFRLTRSLEVHLPETNCRSKRMCTREEEKEKKGERKREKEGMSGRQEKTKRKNCRSTRNEREDKREVWVERRGRKSPGGVVAVVARREREEKKEENEDDAEEGER